MLRLRPYKACDAQTITNWLKDEYAFRQWSADRYEKYPISAEDMNLYYDKDRDNEKIWGMTAFDDTKRGKGYGKEMLSLAVQYAFDFIKVRKISLGVFENNITAIHCYRSCGFSVVELETVESYSCMGETWNCIEMELVK